MGEVVVGESSGSGGEQRQDSGLGREWLVPLDPASFGEECLSAAEDAVHQVLSCIHPTLDSEEKRRDVIDYVQRLIKSRLDCEVFPYGSLPLKTYLPDGDIDFTVINGNTANESLALDVHSLLKREQNLADAEFKVTDTQYIDAEVKIVKCLVQDTIIDISFNQLGGLSALCFLEQVDRVVGRNHLFKRSILLIKAWCYYESRILGAQHGLISTYALETLVLFIFHFFFTYLRGPLSVLCIFLDYYSKFDWENDCISLKGPVCKSSLPDIVVKLPENGWTRLFFSEEFLENCMEMFSVSSREVEDKLKPFQPKHLNIIDPLKENNNLGRSVHIGNFHRVRSALKYGARKLNQVLSLPSDKVSDGMHKFFSNILATHGYENRNIIQHLNSGFGNYGVDLEYRNEKRHPMLTASEGWSPLGLNDVGEYMPFETYDAIRSNSYLWNGSMYYASPCSYSAPVSWNNGGEPFCEFSNLSAGHGTSETGTVRNCNLGDYAFPEYGFWSCWENSNENNDVNFINLGSSVVRANNVDDTNFDFKDTDLTSMGELEAFNPLADLTGDYDSHIRSLLYGQFCHGFSLSALFYHASSRPTWSENTNPCNIVCRPVSFCWTRLSQMNSHPIPAEQSNSLTVDSAPPTSEEQKARGKAPVVNGSFGERHPPQWRNNKTVSGFNRHNGESSSSRAAPARVTVAAPAHVTSVVKKENSTEEEKGKSRSQHERKVEATSKSPPPVGNQNENQANDDSWKIEFGTIGNLAEEVSNSCPEDCDSPGEERLAGKPIQLINDDEFPPLC